MSRVGVKSPALWFAAYVLLFTVFYGVSIDPTISALPGFAVSPDELALIIDTGTLSRRIAFIALGVFGIFMFASARDRNLVPKNWLAIAVIALLAWTSLSLLWSDSQALTIRRLTVFLLMCIGAYGLSRRIVPRDIWKIVFAVASTNLLLGIIGEVAIGTFMPDAEGYRFAGMLHPNSQGLSLAMLILAAVCTRPPSHALVRLVWSVVVVAAIAFLILTKSRNSVASLAIALMAYWFIVLPWRYKLGSILFTSCALTAVLLMLLIDAVHPFLLSTVELGRSDSDIATLTGRLELWKVALSYALERPVLGYGYEAFWFPEHVFAVSSKIGWGVLHAHSIYVDTLLSLGVVGLVLLLNMLFSGAIYAVRQARHAKSTEVAGFAALLFFVLSFSSLETSLTSASFFGFVVMVVLSMLAFPQSHSQTEI